MKRLAFAALAVVLSSAVFAAPPQQVGGWTVESIQNPTEKADYSVRVKKTVGDATVLYRISALTSEEVTAKVGDCYTSSSFSLYDDSGKPLPRGATIKKELEKFLSELSGTCKAAPATNTQLVAGFDQAIAAADTRFKTKRPKPDLTVKSSGAGGWAFKDTPSIGPDGVTVEHLLSMSRTVGGLKLNYDVTVVPNDTTSYGSQYKTIKGSLKDCTYEDTDESDFLDVGRRAKDIRDKIKVNLPSSMYNCEIGESDVAAALIGFETAYGMIDKWRVDRTDEYKLLIRAANEFANSDEQRF